MIEYSVKMLDGSRHNFQMQDEDPAIDIASGKFLVVGDGKTTEYLSTNMIVSITKKEI